MYLGQIKTVGKGVQNSVLQLKQNLACCTAVHILNVKHEPSGGMLPQKNLKSSCFKIEFGAI